MKNSGTSASTQFYCWCSKCVNNFSFIALVKCVPFSNLIIVFKPIAFAYVDEKCYTRIIGDFKLYVHEYFIRKYLYKQLDLFNKVNSLTGCRSRYWIPTTLWIIFNGIYERSLFAQTRRSFVFEMFSRNYVKILVLYKSSRNST